MKRILEMMVLLPVAGFALPVLIDSALKGAVVMGTVLLAMLMLRSAPAALRHLVLVAAMVGLLVLPIFSLTLPGWRVLPAWAQTRAAVEEPVKLAETEPVAQVGSDFFPEAIEAGLAATLATETIKTPENSAQSWVPLAVWAWLIGGVVLSLRLMLSQWALWRLGRSALGSGDRDQLAMLEELRTDLGIRRRVGLLIHPDRAMPMTWGLFKTRLLLPAESSDWQEGRLRAVLLHELAHVKRRDCVTQLMVQAVCAVHWFNPLVWVAARRIAIERERACDDLVLNSGIRASDYAEHLLRIATGYEDRPVAAAAALAMACKSRLEGRLTSILNQRTNRRTISRRLALCVAIALALLSLPVAMMRAVADEDPTQKNLEDLAAEWADRTAVEKELDDQPTLPGGGVRPLHQPLRGESDFSALFNATKTRYDVPLIHPDQDVVVTVAFVADHYSEKYKGNAQMQKFAEQRVQGLEKTQKLDRDPNVLDQVEAGHSAQ